MSASAAVGPATTSVLAVCAHPDDESFGLGAVLTRFADAGATVSMLCFTHGEASTLGRSDRPLGEVRRAELTAAAAVLGVGRVALLDYPDGGLAEVPLERLAADVADELNAEFSAGFVGRDAGGVDLRLDVDRAVQRRAIACHASQAHDNPVLARRLELLGDTESLVWLRPAVRDPRAGGATV